MLFLTTHGLIQSESLPLRSRNPLHQFPPSLQNLRGTRLDTPLSSVPIVKHTCFPQSATLTSSVSIPKSSGSQNPTSRPTHSAAIEGGVIGGVLALILVVLAALFLMRRRRVASTGLDGMIGKEGKDMTFPSGYTPTNNQGSAPSSLGSNNGGFVTPMGVPSYREAPSSMITAPTNEDEEYYYRIVREGRGVHVQNHGLRNFYGIPEVT